MNEDESTQSLSDKVLDRSNLLRFPKPRNLHGESNDENQTEEIRQNHFLQWSKWEKWRCSTLTESSQNDLKNHITELNKICDSAERAFGHRMGQAITAYVANYPNSEQNLLISLADQVEMRILPKLRGVDVDNVCFNKLVDFANSDLHDEELAKAIKDARDRSKRSDRLFVWRGFQREDD